MKSQKPIIGILLNASFTIDQDGLLRYYVRDNYVKSIQESGGVPIMIAHKTFDLIDQYLELIDGLLITGCDFDINPKFYGQNLMTDKIDVLDEKTEFELEFTKRALAKNIAFLGICNGEQVLNVACGGSLIQDIPEFRPSDLIHRHSSPLTEYDNRHLVKIKQGTILHNISAGQTEVRVNSRHHQAVDEVGEGLIASAIAPDGIIEAVESVSHDFVIGVEWHPEYLTNQFDRDIFKSFIKAASDIKNK